MNLEKEQIIVKVKKSKNNGYALVGKRFKEVIAEEKKEDNYFRIKNWYF